MIRNPNLRELFVLSISIVLVNLFFRLVKCFISVTTLFDFSVALSSVSSGSVISLVCFCLQCSNLQTIGECLFCLRLWHVDSRFGHLWLGFQLVRFVICNFVILVFFQSCSVFACICFVISSPLNSFSRFDISASVVVLFFFYPMSFVVFVRLFPVSLNFFLSTICSVNFCGDSML